MHLRSLRRLTRCGGPFARPLRIPVLAVVLFAGACGARGAPAPAVELTWSLRPQVPSVGPATLTVTLRDAGGGPVTNAVVRLEGHMSHPGMAPVLATADERTPGVYEAGFAFTMQGDWVLLVSAAVPGGARVERRIDVANVRPSN